jgi:hypothetical protein
MSQPPVPPPYGSAPPPEPYGPPPGDRRAPGLIAAVVIGALVLVGGIVGAIVLVGGGDDETDRDDTAVSVEEGPESGASPSPPATTPAPTTAPPASDPPASTGSTGSPQGTADAFAAAVRGQDCAALDALTTSQFRTSFDCEVDLQMPAGLAWELGDPEVLVQRGDFALARAVMVIEGTEVPITSRLVTVDGRWLVDSLDLSEFPDLSQH